MNMEPVLSYLGKNARAIFFVTTAVNPLEVLYCIMYIYSYYLKVQGGNGHASGDCMQTSEFNGR